MQANQLHEPPFNDFTAVTVNKFFLCSESADKKKGCH
jgi:hypothetical protein